MMPFGAHRSVLFGSGIGALEVLDNFNRADGPLIGSTTSDGRAEWQLINGTGSSWEVYNNQARYTGSASDNPIAVVDTRTPDIDITLDCGWGTDAIYFRVVDANNWLRVQTYSWSSTSCSTCYNYNYNRTCNFTGAGEPDCEEFQGFCTSSSNCGSCPSCSTTCCSTGSCTQGSTCGSYSCNCNTNYYYRSEFDKMVGGTLTQIDNWSGQHTDLRVIADGNSVRVYTETVDRGIYTVNDHLDAELHGIGRASSSRTNTALDNFHATPI